MKRASADMEVRGADPDYNNRGGRSAAMDPSTATEAGTGRGGGQKRQERSGDAEDGRGAPVARGSTAASSSGWWSARGPGWGEGHDGEGRREVPPPAAGCGATATDPNRGHVVPSGASASPPGFDADAEHDGAASGTGTHALDAEGMAPCPLVSDEPVTPRAWSLALLPQRGISDKWTGPPGPSPATDHRDMSCPPIAKGTRRRSVVRGPTAPWTALAAGDLVLAMVAPQGPAPKLGRMAIGSFFYVPLGAVCVGGGASAVAQQDPRSGQGGTDDGRPGGSGAGHHGGAVQVKLEAGARPSSPGADVFTDNGASGEALPVPSDASDGKTHFDTGGDQPLEGASGDGDGLPSFSPVDEAPASLAGPEGASFGAAAAPASPGDETSTAGDDLLLLPPAGGGRGVDGPGGEARTPEAGDGCLPLCGGDWAGRAAPRSRLPPCDHGLRWRHRGWPTAASV